MGKMGYDVVYYYAGGRWHAANPFVSRTLGGVDGNFSELIERTERMGFHAVPGRLSTGAPEGAPTRRHVGCACEHCYR